MASPSGRGPGPSSGPTAARTGWGAPATRSGPRSRAAPPGRPPSRHIAPRGRARPSPPLPGQATPAREPIRLDFHQLTLNLEGVPAGEGSYDLRFSVWPRHAGELLGAPELRGGPA